jgi:hypothetical protein
MLGDGHRLSDWGGFGCCFSVILKIRSESIAVEQKRPRGRPRTGVYPARAVRMPPELEAKITAWIERQPEPKPSRSEAIRRLVERGLAAN